jgi:hypothetical protein
MELLGRLVRAWGRSADGERLREAGVDLADEPAAARVT